MYQPRKQLHILNFPRQIRSLFYFLLFLSICVRLQEMLPDIVNDGGPVCRIIFTYLYCVRMTNSQDMTEVLVQCESRTGAGGVECQ